MPAQDDWVGGRVLGGQIPQAGGLVIAAGDQPAAVRADGEAVDAPSCPRRTTGLAAGSWAVRSHRRAVLSRLPVTSQWPSGLMARAVMLPSCPRRTSGLVAGSRAVRSHRRAVLSSLPVTSQRPSGLKARAVDGALCPAKTSPPVLLSTCLSESSAATACCSSARRLECTASRARSRLRCGCGYNSSKACAANHRAVAMRRLLFCLFTRRHFAVDKLLLFPPSSLRWLPGCL